MNIKAYGPVLIFLLSHFLPKPVKTFFRSCMRLSKKLVFVASPAGKRQALLKMEEAMILWPIISTWASFTHSSIIMTLFVAQHLMMLTQKRAFSAICRPLGLLWGRWTEWERWTDYLSYHQLLSKKYFYKSLTASLTHAVAAFLSISAHAVVVTFTAWKKEI